MSIWDAPEPGADPRRPAAAALLGALCALLAGCGADTPPAGEPRVAQATAVAAPDRGRLVRSLALDPESLDPHRAESLQAGHVLRELFEGLVAEDAEGRPIPGAALAWSHDPEWRLWRFELRPEARWSDGRPLTAADWVASFRRALDPATGSRSARLLEPIRHAAAVRRGEAPPEALGVVAEGPLRLRIELEHPLPGLPALLALPIAFPVRLSAASAAPLGNGPFVLAERVPGSHLRLIPNPHFHAAAEVAIGELVYLPIEQASAGLARYRAGELDWLDELPATAAAALPPELAPELVVLPVLGTYYFGLNTTRPPLADPRVRLALALALDRDAIASLLGVPGRAAVTLVPPGVPEHRPQPPPWTGEPLAARQRRAQALLAAAGYGPGRPLRFELRHNTGEDHRRIAIAAAASWSRALPVEVRLHHEEFRSFLATRRRRETEMFRAGWVADLPDPLDFLALFRSGDPRNDCGFADPEFDALLARAEGEADPRRRAEWLAHAERRLLEAAPVIPVYHYVSRRLIRPWVRGWRPNPLDRHPSRWLRIEGRPAAAR
ncbi:MAG: peptide ABC transporter substrate-binding protein [Xanthomonadales bacterium]|nr:peptide ABC transporter substrate-binding protein [Xanthomonadales bacterium]